MVLGFFGVLRVIWCVFKVLFLGVLGFFRVLRVV